VSEHLCQGDWGGNFSTGNSSLWQILPRVFGFSVFLFLNFSAKREKVARVIRTVCTTHADRTGDRNNYTCEQQQSHVRAV
jgi:hypothetical protein